MTELKDPAPVPLLGCTECGYAESTETSPYLPEIRCPSCGSGVLNTYAEPTDLERRTLTAVRNLGPVSSPALVGAVDDLTHGEVTRIMNRLLCREEVRLTENGFVADRNANGEQ